MDLDRKLKMALDSGNEQKINSIFEEIYREYGKLVFFCISKYVSNRLDIEELTNDVFLNFFNHLENISQLRSIKYYLMTSAKNAGVNFLKKKKLETVALNESFDVEKNNMFQHESVYSQVLNQMKEILSEKEIEIIIDHQFYGLQLKEIAKQTNTSANTIKSIYRRAIKKLQQKYKGDKKNE